MTRASFTSSATLLFGILFAFLPHLALAEEFLPPDFRFNNINWFAVPHPTVASFTMAPDRNAHGTTTTGIPFRLFNIPTSDGVMLQRFEIQDHFHYLVNGRVVYTLPEVSAALALASE